MQKYFYISLFLFPVLLFGCDPYRFKAETKYPVDCRIFSDNGSVESNLYGFRMHSGASLGITSIGWTQYDLSAYLTLSGGEGFQVLLRPVVEESVIDSGLTLTFSSQGLRLDSAGNTLERNPAFHFPKDSQTYITVYNEEAYLQVTVGCDTILKHYSRRKSSDDIVLKTLPGSELNVLDPQWKQIKFVEGDDVKVEDIKR